MPPEPEVRVEHALFVRSMFAVRPPTRVVSQLAARMRDHPFRKGEIIFERGRQSHTVYFVVDGQVSLTAPDVEPWNFDSGATIGIADAVLERPHARTARAESDAHLVSVEFEDYTDILEDNFGFAKQLLEQALSAVYDLGRELAPEGVFAPEDLRGANPLPTRPRQDLDEMRRLLSLRDVQALSVAPVQPLVTLARNARVAHFEPGEVLFEAQAPAPHLFVLTCGEVEVSHPSYRAQFETGGLVGAHAAVAFDRHPHRAEALAETTALRIAKEDVFDVMEDHFGFARCMFAWLARENERTRAALARRRATT